MNSVILLIVTKDRGRGEMNFPAIFLQKIGEYISKEGKKAEDISHSLIADSADFKENYQYL